MYSVIFYTVFFDVHLHIYFYEQVFQTTKKKKSKNDFYFTKVHRLCRATLHQHILCPSCINLYYYNFMFHETLTAYKSVRRRRKNRTSPVKNLWAIYSEFETLNFRVPVAGISVLKLLLLFIQLSS